MSEKIWHPNFIKYMDTIINHENYRGLPIKQKNDGSYAWISTAKSKIGKSRIEWALNKAKQLNIPIKAGVYSNVMFEIHPTKEKVCQICGKTMSIKYIYPNKNFIKYLSKHYGYQHDIFDSIYDINFFLTNKNISENEIKNIYISKLKLPKDNLTLSLYDLMNKVENHCRTGNSNLCGPGAMSNFPDRFDGFHTYNRCCRSIEDTGRRKDNMRTYTKDRRAYEYWSDGNIHAANKFMGSSFFKETSADHIGPISLGFIHDPRFLQPMPLGNNSAKRDRLTYEDFTKLKEKESEYSISPVSWFAQIIWEHMKTNSYNSSIDLDYYRTLLKTNMTNFMHCLYLIIINTDDKGKVFLEHFYLKPKMIDFQYDYVFNDNGSFSYLKRNITDSTKKEYERFKRIAFQAIKDYEAKDNRNLKISSFTVVHNDLKSLYNKINKDPYNKDNKILFETIVAKLQQELF